MSDGTTGPEILARWGGIIDQAACDGSAAEGCAAALEAALASSRKSVCGPFLGPAADRLEKIISIWREDARKEAAWIRSYELAHEVLRQELER